jgi:hypothetical protein
VQHLKDGIVDRYGVLSCGRLLNERANSAVSKCVTTVHSKGCALDEASTAAAYSRKEARLQLADPIRRRMRQMRTTGETALYPKLIKLPIIEGSKFRP